MKSTEKWFFAIFVLLCGVWFLSPSLDPEVEIKSISFRDPIAEMVESKGIECVTEKKDMAEEVEPTEEIQVFSLLLSPEKLLYTADKSNNTEVEKVYWLGIGNKKMAKYVQKFSYEENGEKFKVGDYNTEDGNIVVTFYRHVGRNICNLVKFAIGVLFGLLLALGFSIIFRSETETKKDEDGEKKDFVESCN